MCSAEGSLKQWLPNGKLLLLSLTKCHGVPCSLPSRTTTKVLKNCKTFSSRPRPNVQDQDQVFMIQDQDQHFHFCPRGASRPWSRGLHHCMIRQCFTTQHQICKTKTKKWSGLVHYGVQDHFLVSDWSCPKPDGLRQHHWN